jgi:hypothetical protein
LFFRIKRQATSHLRKKESCAYDLFQGIDELAPVARIEPYGDSGKYKVIFSEPAKKIGPIPFGNAPSGAMQGPRYTTYKKLETAKTMMDLVGKM